MRHVSPLILMIDDNIADVELTREALREVDFQIELSSVRDGLEALAFLRRQGSYSAERRPDLIFLDLNMPRMDGRETLRLLKSQSDVCDIPIIVFSTSESAFDVQECYRNHAAAFVTKPVVIEELVDKLSAIATLWLTGTAAQSLRQAKGLMSY